MVTVFTCGIYTATYVNDGWDLKIHPHNIGVIHDNGETLQITTCCLFPIDDLMEIAVLMNNIKRQYKQLQTN